MPTFNPSTGYYKPGMRPLISIAGTPILDPWEYNATTSTVVDSGRNVRGEMIGAIIRDSMCKIEAVWQYIPADEWSKILKLFNESLGGHFINDVTFYNQDTNDWETRKLYVSDKTAKLFLRNKNGDVRGFTGARIALIEV